jgi:hypothetical protein
MGYLRFVSAFVDYDISKIYAIKNSCNMGKIPSFSSGGIDSE